MERHTRKMDAQIIEKTLKREPKTGKKAFFVHKLYLEITNSKNIEVKTALEILPKLVNDAVFNLRRVLIGKKIDELVKQATEEVAIDLESIKGYTGLKISLFEKLNRVV